ncbi:hypothetical protein D9758_018377 [Tetrapyrgos nigripes]|uniref:Cytochrome P450 n=1 Tax=Tetrapyrgos nigripes TaxID=182062 RepID=A0A8H5F151_9AGAR|nr:hypothetical protein D9758_018377 [Tetrapyrgos nigripes]
MASPTSFASLPVSSVWILVLVAATAGVYRWFRRISIKHIPGPVDEGNFWCGNLPDLLQKQVGENFAGKRDMAELLASKGLLGSVLSFCRLFVEGAVLMDGYLGQEDRLFVCDPKAMQYILQVSGYRWPKPRERRAATYMLAGKAISFAEGDDHKRHRNVMQPGFGVPETKALLPWFSAAASSVYKITSQWKDILSMSAMQSEVFNLYSWVSRGALDALGNGAFDHQFNAVNYEKDPVSNALSNFIFLFFKPTSNGAILFLNFVSTLPFFVQRWLNEKLPGPRMDEIRRTRRLATELANELVHSKVRELRDGEGKADVMSLLVKANLSENERGRLTEEEIHSQIRAIFVAGHETTANSVGWALLELCRHPEMQKRLRREIRAKEREVRARNGVEGFSVMDLESMEYLNAETLRFHPVTPVLYREAGEDDCIPLYKPIITTHGETITEIPVAKGTKVTLSVATYNRTKEIFGEDTDSFNPDRWLNQSQKIGQGVPSLNLYANLATFSAGVKSCIGWRFAVLEFQCFLAELISNFEFSLTKESERIRREPCLVMLPTVEDELDKGPQLILKVSVSEKEQ